jgi:NAD(P)-dependent dehydrogenase (short-subunit alcohol dehydrogenase family)
MQTILVTGAGRGIGLEFIRQILARGDRAIAATRAASPALDAMASGAGSRLLRVMLDPADDASITAARATVGATIDAIDVVINNAGIYSTLSPSWNPELTGFGSLSGPDLVGTFRINTVGPMLVTRTFLDLLAKGTHARLVNISSLLGSVSGKTSGGDYAYVASKAALNICTRALAVDLAPHGVIAIAMTPGWVRTDMGGSNATLSPEESVRGMLEVIDRLTAADAGRFVDQEGIDQPW